MPSAQQPPTHPMVNLSGEWRLPFWTTSTLIWFTEARPAGQFEYDQIGALLPRIMQSPEQSPLLASGRPRYSPRLRYAYSALLLFCALVTLVSGIVAFYTGSQLIHADQGLWAGWVAWVIAALCFVLAKHYLWIGICEWLSA